MTAAAKMRDAVVAASSYGGQRVQTHYFHTNAEWLRGNIAAARTLVDAATSNARRVEKRAADGRFVFRDVPHDFVLDFLSNYKFDKKSPENDAELIGNYIRKRVTAGSLGRWNVAIVGTPAGKGEDFTFAPHVTVGRNNRARLALENPDPDFADIKTLMSRRDAAVDLTGDIGKLTEKEIAEERRKQLPDTGLLVLYPIDKLSRPSPSKTLRAPLDAEEHVIGVGLVFPKPQDGDSTVKSYISADLSNVNIEIEEEDYSLVDGEDA